MNLLLSINTIVDLKFWVLGLTFFLTFFNDFLEAYGGQLESESCQKSE